jgi:5-methylcytosine-specific restriction protein A
MASRAPHYCPQPGCSAIVTRGRCAKHQRERSNDYDSARRGESWRRLYHEARWQRERARWLRRQANLLCVYCLAEGRTTPANSIDHDPPHRGDRAKFYDKSTWRASCVSCNSRRSRRGNVSMARDLSGQGGQNHWGGRAE